MIQTSISTFDRSSPRASSGGPLLQRKCGCGKHTTSGGACSDCCKRDNQDETESRTAPRTEAFRYKMPCKSLGPSPEETGGEERPDPRQGAATIQCDGSGGYQVKLNSWAGAPCGTEACVRAHENSHIADWQAKWPTGCAGQPAGYLPKGDPPDTPLLSVAEYQEFLRESECRAHTVDLQCAQAIPQTGACAATVQDYVKLTEDQRAKHCPSTLNNALIGAGAVGAVGAIAGGLIGGPIGALVGAGIGTVVGGLGSLLF